jgi:hypothetical protein
MAFTWQGSCIFILLAILIPAQVFGNQDSYAHAKAHSTASTNSHSHSSVSYHAPACDKCSYLLPCPEDFQCVSIGGNTQCLKGGSANSPCSSPCNLCGVGLNCVRGTCLSPATAYPVTTFTTTTGATTTKASCGSPCTTDANCQVGTACTISKSGMKKCTRTVRHGGSCSNPSCDVCASGLHCHYGYCRSPATAAPTTTTTTTTAKKTSPSTTTKRRTTYAVTTTATTAATTTTGATTTKASCGSPCTTDANCQVGTACTISKSGMKKCTRSVRRGGSCSKISCERCESGLTCSYGKCVVRSTPAPVTTKKRGSSRCGSCSKTQSCEIGLVCKPFDNEYKCVKFVKLGDACNIEKCIDCAEGNCNGYSNICM